MASLYLSVSWNFAGDTAQKMKFSMKNFFSKCEQIRRNLRIWSHLLKKSLMENFIFFVQWQLLTKRPQVATASDAKINRRKFNCNCLLPCCHHWIVSNVFIFAYYMNEWTICESLPVLRFLFHSHISSFLSQKCNNAIKVALISF